MTEMNTIIETTVNFDEFYDSYDIERFVNKSKNVYGVLSTFSFRNDYNKLLNIVINPDSYNNNLCDIYYDYIIELERKTKKLVPYLKDFEFVKDIYDQVKTVLIEAKKVIEAKKTE